MTLWRIRAKSGGLRKQHLLLCMLALLAASALWLLNVELTFQRNVHRPPAPIEFRRHVITRLWRT